MSVVYERLRFAELLLAENEGSRLDESHVEECRITVDEAEHEGFGDEGVLILSVRSVVLPVVEQLCNKLVDITKNDDDNRVNDERHIGSSLLVQSRYGWV